MENWSKIDRKLIGKRSKLVEIWSKIGRKLFEKLLKIVQDLNENCPKTRRKCSKIQRVGIGKSTGVRREVIGSSSGIHRKLLKNNVVQQLVKSSKLVFKSRYAELIRPCIPYNQVASLDMVPDCTPCRKGPIPPLLISKFTVFLGVFTHTPPEGGDNLILAKQTPLTEQKSTVQTNLHPKKANPINKTENNSLTWKRGTWLSPSHTKLGSWLSPGHF